MELDDLDEKVQPASTDELTSSTTFMEEQSAPLPTSSLYDDETENIPTESNPVSYS